MMGNVFWDDPLVLKEVGRDLIGGTTSAMTAGDSTDPEVKAYLAALEKSYGKEISGLGPSVFTYGYYTAGRALVTGLEAGDGVPDVRTFRRIPKVDQTFGGFFSAESAAPDRNNPRCEQADPPPWVGK